MVTMAGVHFCDSSDAKYTNSNRKKPHMSGQCVRSWQYYAKNPEAVATDSLRVYISVL